MPSTCYNRLSQKFNVCFMPEMDTQILFLKNFFRQNRKSFSTNSVKVGLCSTSNTGVGEVQD